MKKQIIAVVCLLAFSNLGLSQSEFLERQAEKAKNKVANRVENKIDQGMDKTLDKTEEGIEGSVKGTKKEKKESTSKKSSNPENSSKETNNSSEKNTASKSGTSSNTTKNSNNSETTSELKAYSKFDFIQGDKVIGMEQFEETSIGDFPLGWNTNSSAELVQLGDGKWLRLLQDGYFLPEFVTNLPENFTLEFDVFTRYRSSNILTYGFDICSMNNQRKDIATDIRSGKAGFEFLWGGCIAEASYNIFENGELTNSNNNLNIPVLACQGDNYEYYSKVHFSIWRQKNRLRIYVNESKVVDIPYALMIENKYNVFRFKTNYMGFATSDNKDEVMVSEIRYAVGAPDTRNKLITEGKLVSRGILFDINSDKIKPESYGILKDIATVLKENPTIKVQIVGHTDSDGDEEKNLELSKKRAASVKQSLVKEFGVNNEQLTTDGKGESQPLDPNTTAAGKANNRRVEFIKQ